MAISAKIERIIKQFIEDPEYKLCQYALLFIPRERIPDRMWIKYLYHYVTGHSLNLRHPKTFNEKLNWLKLHDHNPLYTTLADKIKAKDWVAEQIGYEYIIPTLAVWNRIEDIDIKNLPNQFVLKCNHDAGSTVICQDKATFDLTAAKAVLAKALNRNFYKESREWAYKNIQPKVFAEAFVGEQLNDYKFFTFHGIVKCFKIDFDRYTDHHANYYDRNMNLLPFGEQVFPPIPDKKVDMPSNIQEMIAKAETIGSHAPFLRVDMYNVGGRILFGECTFYPAGGYGAFTDKHWELQLGDWI